MSFTLAGLTMTFLPNFQSITYAWGQQHLPKLLVWIYFSCIQNKQQKLYNLVNIVILFNFSILLFLTETDNFHQKYFNTNIYDLWMMKNNHMKVWNSGIDKY